MNFPLFLARRIYSENDGKHKVSRPVINIATFGVAIGLGVMIVTVSVVLGFKNTIRDKVVGFGGHILVSNFLTLQSADPYPICIDDSMMNVINKIEDVKNTGRFALTQGVLKTNTDFLGINFKGVSQEYDFSFIMSNLIEGEIPEFTDSTSSSKILLSKTIADKLCLKIDDKVYAYFVSEDVRARRFTVCGIYQTNMTQFDDLVCFTDLNTVVKLNGWERGQCTGVELSLTNFSKIEDVESNVDALINRTYDKYGQVFSSQTVKETYPQIFSWLSLLDINVWIIFALMICVAGFTMIAGLLIIILERTQMIGILKSLGTTNTTIRNTFLWFAVFIIGKGIVIGNVLGIGIVTIQCMTGIVKLDQQIYYVDTVPMEFNTYIIILLNIATLLICVLVLIAPSFFVSHIRPVKTMQYD